MFGGSFVLGSSFKLDLGFAKWFGVEVSGFQEAGCVDVSLLCRSGLCSFMANS